MASGRPLARGSLAFGVFAALLLHNVAARENPFIVPCGPNGTNVTFHCASSTAGVCIDSQLVCNGINNCGNNADEQNCSASKNGWQGFVGAALTALFFGTNLVPVKKFETGDGMFFQWCMCAGIWFVGLGVQVRAKAGHCFAEASLQTLSCFAVPPDCWPLPSCHGPACT